MCPYSSILDRLYNQQRMLPIIILFYTLLEANVFLVHAWEVRMFSFAQYMILKIDIFTVIIFSFCICVWFIQNGLDDTRSQTLPVNSSLSEQNGSGDSSSEIQSQRSPDGSEDGDSSQSKSRFINSSYTWWWIACSNNLWCRIRPNFSGE